MRYLLDTCAFLWWTDADPKLSKPAEAAIGDPANEVYFTVVSSWEIAIKVRIGKLALAQPVSSYIADQLALYPFIKLLPVELQHSYRAATLPRHHDDPFDLLIIAQAQEENLIILSSDHKFPAYPVGVLW